MRCFSAFFFRSVGTNAGQTVQGNAASFDPAISNDGSYISFATDATWNGVDPNGVTDVYERYQGDTALRRISSPTSETPEGAFLDAASTSPAMSGNGLTVAFETAASSVLTGQTRPQPGVDIYSHTWGNVRTTCQTELETAQRPVTGNLTRDATEEAVVQGERESCDDASHVQFPTNTLPLAAVHLTGGSPDNFVGTAISPLVPPDQQPGVLKFPMRNGRALPVPTPVLWIGFGYYHTVAKHGWTAQEKSEVQQVITTGIRLNPGVNGTRFVYEGTYFSGAHGTNCLRRVVVEMAPGLGGTVDLMGVLTTYAYKIP